jgi:hypothetical protein
MHCTNVSFTKDPTSIALAVKSFKDSHVEEGRQNLDSCTEDSDNGRLGQNKLVSSVLYSDDEIVIRNTKIGSRVERLCREEHGSHLFMSSGGKSVLRSIGRMMLG